MLTKIEAVQPVLMSSDVASSARFYERLGFRLTFQDNPNDPKYAAVMRDGVELHLQWHDRSQWAHHADRPTYRFVVAKLDDLYAEFHNSGALDGQSSHGRRPWTSPGSTPWGTREFHVLDPDGNGLQFYRPL